MNITRKKTADIAKGIIGGIFIALGALSSIGFTQQQMACVPAVMLLVTGAVLGILLDLVKIHKYILLLVAVGAVCVLLVSDFDYAVYTSAGVVLYMGCALALPEKDASTNALTAAAAAIGFVISVIIIL